MATEFTNHKSHFHCSFIEVKRRIYFLVFINIFVFQWIITNIKLSNRWLMMLVYQNYWWNILMNILKQRYHKYSSIISTNDITWVILWMINNWVRYFFIWEKELKLQFIVNTFVNNRMEIYELVNLLLWKYLYFTYKHRKLVSAVFIQ